MRGGDGQQHGWNYAGLCLETRGEQFLMISDGIDRFGGGGPSNPYVDSAIEEAQRAGVIIYSI
jgi:hypothetical protein